MCVYASMGEPAKVVGQLVALGLATEAREQDRFRRGADRSGCGNGEVASEENGVREAERCSVSAISGCRWSCDVDGKSR